MRRRFILALILAILPFAVLAAGQAAWRLFRAEDQARADLVEAAQVSSSTESNTIAAAEAVMRALANLGDVRAGGEPCSRILAATQIGSPYAGLSRLDASGRVLCSSNPDAVGLNRSDTDWWKLVIERDAFVISKQHVGALINKPIITAAMPLKDGTGAPDGVLALGISTDFLTRSMRERDMADDTVAALVDAGGTIVAASDMTAASSIFGRAPLETGNDLHELKDSSGETWRYAVAPVHGDDLFIAFARRGSALLGWNYFDFAVNIFLPVMMALFAFIAIWYAADRFVLRWINYLQRVARAYGGGHLAFRPDTREAPLEIKDLADTMSEMADSLSTRDASLRQSLEQQTHMVREIHHRVKNNLQIVASLLQIESRRLPEPAAREALRITHTRINAIALVHRVLEEVDGRTVVNARTLLRDLTRLLTDAFAGEYVGEGITVEAPDMLIDTDAAVPLALYLVEQVSDIYGRALARKRPLLGLTIEMTRSDSGLRLVVSCNGEDCVEEIVRGPNFAAAYVRQLEGRLSRVGEGGRSNIIMDFAGRWIVQRPEAIVT